MTTLNRTVALEQVDHISCTIGQELNLDMAGLVQEPLNEHSSVAESLLGFGGGTFESLCKLGLGANDTHAAATASHGSLDNNWEAILCSSQRTVISGQRLYGGDDVEENE